MVYDPQLEKHKIEFESSSGIRNLFGVNTTEEISELAKTGMKNGKNRVLNIAGALGVPDSIIEAEESFIHSLVLPSEDNINSSSLQVKHIGLRKDELFKVKPSLLFLNQIYRGLEMAHNQVAGLESNDDYVRLKTETFGFAFRYGVAQRIITSMQEKLPGDKSIFKEKDSDSGINSFAGFIATKHLMVDAYGVLSVSGIQDIQSEFPESVKLTTKAMITRDKSKARALSDAATSGVVRPMTQEEALNTVAVYYKKSRPYSLVA